MTSLPLSPPDWSHTMTQQTPDTISHDFHRYGLDGLGLNRAAERRAVERDRDRVTADLRAPGRPSSVRRWLGTTLIAVGGPDGRDDADARPRHRDRLSAGGGVARMSRVTSSPR
jgi:hypothetical protein